MTAGHLRKMEARLDDGEARYELLLGESRLPVSDWIGSRLRLRYQGEIRCVYCDRATKKSFNQGHCYPCFRKLARCDSCIMSPEKCHYFQGTCREPEWGERNCMRDHFVYLANTSGIKVGITRGNQLPTRWLDQGATQALPVFRVSNRLQSGLVEVAFKGHVKDKTAWQTMLKGNAEPVDLKAAAAELLALVEPALAPLRERFGLGAIEALDETPVTIRYPVLEWPTKVKAHNLDKTPELEGTLWGIKGQYLMLDTGVINIRKYGGYSVSVELLD